MPSTREINRRRLKRVGSDFIALTTPEAEDDWVLINVNHIASIASDGYMTRITSQYGGVEMVTETPSEIGIELGILEEDE